MKKRISKESVMIYIGQGSVKIKEEKHFTLAPPDITLTSQATDLLHMFHAAMGIRIYNESMDRYKQFHMLTFMKLAQRLNGWQEKGIIINTTNYMLAHKWYYGKDIQVKQLFSKNSYEIYQSYMRLQKSLQITYTRKEYEAYDRKVLNDLSILREEPIEETYAMLKLCGLL